MIRQALIIMSILALAGCAPADQQSDSSSGSTSVGSGYVQQTEPTEGGIGGTGIVVAGQEGGIGGTGAPRLAGTLGTVTGFGSIHVNGLRIIFPESGAVASPSGSLAESDIDLGETVEILGVLQSDGTVKPTQAMFRFPLVGRIEGIDTTGSTLNVMGARVVLEPGALVVDETKRPARITIGDLVQVSGLPRGDEVVASRIEKMLTPARTSVMGRVEVGPKPSTVLVNGVTVDYGNSTPPRPGWSVRVTGSYEAGRLIPYETIRSLLETVSDPIRDISIEGYLDSRPVANGVGIGGFGLDFDAGSKVTELAGGRALFIGSLENGNFKARHGLPLPAEVRSRHALLEAVENGYAPAGAVETR